MNDLINQLTVYQPPQDKVRIGRNIDGGYVGVDIKPDILLSGGIGPDISFELNFIERYNVPVICVDSEFGQGCYKNLKHFKENYPKKDSHSFLNIDFIEKLVGGVDNGKYTNFSTYFKKYNNITLKLDIEGGEYAFINSLSEDFQNKIDQLFLELHQLQNLNTFNTIKKLNKTHVLIHAHGNNCGISVPVKKKYFHIGNTKIPKTLECTFLHKKYFKKLEVNTETLPTHLDYANQPRLPELDINYPPFRYDPS